MTAKVSAVCLCGVIISAYGNVKEKHESNDLKQEFAATH